jgi:hypothetical protein
MRKYLQYWPIAVIIVLCLLLAFSGVLDSCSKRQTSKVISEITTSTRDAQIVDSMRSVQAKREKSVIDSTVQVYEKKVNDRDVIIQGNKKKISSLKTQTDTLQSKLKLQIETYKKDTASQNPLCDSISKNAEALTDSLNMENEYLQNNNDSLQSSVNDLKKSNEELKQKNIIQENETKTAEVSRDKAYVNLDKATIQLKTQTNWWHRNQKWIYFGAGAILTGLILK